MKGKKIVTKTKSPIPAQIRAARERMGLTHAQAAALIGYRARSWYHWEQGTRTMRPVVWRSFLSAIDAAEKLPAKSKRGAGNDR